MNTHGKKICYFINSDWYFDLHWIDRAIAASKDGYNISIISNFRDNGLLEKFNRLGFTCYKIPLNEKDTNILKFAYNMLSVFLLLNKISPDLLHCITIKPCVIGGIWGRLLNKKFICSFVGLGRVFEMQSTKYKVIRKIVIYIYNFIFSKENCRLIFEHEGDRSKLNDMLDVSPSKFIVIDGAGIDIQAFPYSPESSVLNENKKVNILFASRLLKTKGLQDLIEAVRSLKYKHNIEILVAGIFVDNDPDALTQEDIDNWIENNDIHWLGKSNNISSLIQQSSFVVLPSIYPEGIPRILLEAGSVGRACITYNISGCGSLIKHGINGLLVEKKDIHELADAIDYLIVNKEKRLQMGENARRIIINKYSSNIIIARTLFIYKKLLQSKL